jgi:hypothetical protein
MQNSKSELSRIVACNGIVVPAFLAKDKKWHHIRRDIQI